MPSRGRGSTGPFWRGVPGLAGAVRLGGPVSPGRVCLERWLLPKCRETSSFGRVGLKRVVCCRAGNCPRAEASTGATVPALVSGAPHQHGYRATCSARGEAAPMAREGREWFAGPRSARTSARATGAAGAGGATRSSQALDTALSSPSASVQLCSEFQLPVILALTESRGPEGRSQVSPPLAGMPPGWTPAASCCDARDLWGGGCKRGHKVVS